PPGPVTVTLTNPDTGAITLSASTLSFTTANYATDQIVTITGVQDIDVGNESVPITLSASGMANVTVTATVIDDDIQAFVVAPTSMTVSEGANGSFNVSLA